MRNIESIGKDELKNFLGKGWLTHDGMWFYHTYLECGIEQTNRLNKSAIKSMAAIEAQRTLKILEMNKSDITSMKELTHFMHNALQLILPYSIIEKAKFVPSENSILWEWEENACFAYNGIKMLGVLDEYQCGVIYRIECWLETLGIPFEVKPKIEKCIMHTNGRCAGEFVFNF